MSAARPRPLSCPSTKGPAQKDGGSPGPRLTPRARQQRADRRKCEAQMPPPPILILGERAALTPAFTCGLLAPRCGFAGILLRTTRWPARLPLIVS